MAPWQYPVMTQTKNARSHSTRDPEWDFDPGWGVDDLGWGVTAAGRA